jgi:hypothetical protein
MTEPYPSWQKKENFSFRAAWLSKKNLRTQFAQELALTSLARGRATPHFLQMELEAVKYREKSEGWHLLFVLDMLKMFDSFQHLTNHVQKFLKTSDLGPAPLEIMFHDAKAPIKLNRPQRMEIFDKFLKALKAHPFSEKGNEMFTFIEPMKDYALELSVEWSNFRRFIDTTFAADDNPIKSLVAKVCRVEEIAFDADRKERPQKVAEGVLELSGNAVRVGTWEHTFDDNDEVFESVAYEEVNIASESLQKSIYFEAVDREDE